MVLRLSLFKIVFAFSIFATALSCKAKDKAKILYISSYNSSFPTFFKQVSGLRSVLDSLNVHLDIECLDSKRFQSEENLMLFHKLLSYKIKKSEPYDIVLTGDDNAFLYAISQQDSLFINTPIIFFGVNNLKLALAQNKKTNITGVVEATSFKETLHLMQTLCGNSAEIYAVSDSSTSGQNDLKTFYALASQFQDTKFKHLSLSESNLYHFAKQLSQIPRTTPVLLLSAYHPKDSKSLSFKEGIRIVRTHLNAPLFHLWYHGNWCPWCRLLDKYIKEND